MGGGQERTRYRIVDREALAAALGVGVPALAEVHREWVETVLREGQGRRERRWTEGVAVGSRGFVEQVQRELGGRGRYRGIEPEGGGYVLREGAECSGRYSAGETASLRRKSARFGDMLSYCFADLQRCHPTHALGVTPR